MVERLLRVPNVSATAPYGRALTDAAFFGRAAVVERLLAEPRLRHRSSRADALQWATTMEHESIVRALSRDAAS